MVPIPFVNGFLDWITLFSGLAIIYILLEMFFMKNARGKEFIRKHALFLMFLVSLVAMLGSLYYSDIAGYAPCKLCWYQRVFMYPLPFLMGFAMWKKDRKIIPYAILLSVIGGVLAAYHYILQISQIDSVFCTLVGYAASCSETFFLSLGYITIPMMALTAFLLIIIFGLIGKR